MNGFRIRRKQKLTAEQGAAMATVAARQQALAQALPALVGAKWALLASGLSLLVDVGIILYLVFR